MNRVIIDGSSLTINDVVNVARNFYTVELSEASKAKINEARSLVENIVNTEQMQYGITTGFGKFSDVYISRAEFKKLQRNLGKRRGQFSLITITV